MIDPSGSENFRRDRRDELTDDELDESLHHEFARLEEHAHPPAPAVEEPLNRPSAYRNPWKKKDIAEEWPH